LSKGVQVISQQDLVEVEGLEEAIQAGTLTKNFDSKGVVYEDPETGKMYIISNQ
jgi:hypothetical protein